MDVEEAFHGGDMVLSRSRKGSLRENWASEAEGGLLCLDNGQYILIRWL